MTLADCMAHESIQIPGIGGADVVDPRRGRVRIVRVRTGKDAGVICCGIITNLKPATFVRRGSEVTR